MISAPSLALIYSDGKCSSLSFSGKSSTKFLSLPYLLLVFYFLIFFTSSVPVDLYSDS